MAKYKGGMVVKSGYYWNPRSWEVEVIPSEGGRLGKDGTAYVKVPFPLLFIIVPVLGGLFLMFLPLIGFALFVNAIFKKVTGGVKEKAADLASTMTPGWRPGEAHLTGKPGEEKEGGKPGEAKTTAELEALRKEIDARRDDRKK